MKRLRPHILVVFSALFAATGCCLCDGWIHPTPPAVITDLEPQGVWQQFYALTQIPRPSHHEDQIRAYLLDWGEAHGFTVLRDSIGNVIYRVPATPSREQAPGVILQGHMDMLPNKDPEVTHDFTRDPILPRIQGEYVYATGTTLGADNGIGLASVLALLDDPSLVHGPLEVLITTTEDDGMIGARALAPGLFQGKLLVNVDSEAEGVFYIGCAGGRNINVTYRYQTEPTAQAFGQTKAAAYTLEISGLLGGHSGADIHLGRANAHRLLARVLVPLLRDRGVRLGSLTGGNLRNAIPERAQALLCIPQDQVEACLARITSQAQALQSEFARTDPQLQLRLSPAPLPEEVMEVQAPLRVLEAGLAAPDGVMGMSSDLPDLVETSSNWGILQAQDGEIRLSHLVRSLNDLRKEEAVQSVLQAHATADHISLDSDSPAWIPKPQSPLLHTLQEVYTRCFGTTPRTTAIHAGLECSLLGNTYPQWDMVSIGPTVLQGHTPQECIYIPSVPRFYRFLTALLTHISTQVEG